MTKNKEYLEELDKIILEEKLQKNNYFGKIVVELNVVKSNISAKYVLNNETRFFEEGKSK